MTKTTKITIIHDEFNGGRWICIIRYTIAEELAGLGATVQYACSSDQAQIDERNQEWESKGVKVTGSVFDLKSTTQRENLMNTVSSAFDGKLDILVSSFKSD